jgi:hypothetical protein
MMMCFGTKSAGTLLVILTHTTGMHFPSNVTQANTAETKGKLHFIHNISQQFAF